MLTIGINLTDRRNEASRSKSKESIEFAGDALHLQRRGNDIFDIAMDLPSCRDTIPAMQKSVTEKALLPTAQQKKQISMVKKKVSAAKPRGNSRHKAVSGLKPN